MPTGSGSSASSNVIITVIEPSFKVSKSSNKNYVKVGDTFFYTINIVNDGDYPTIDTIITDVLPAEFNVIEIKANGVVVIGDLSLGVSLGPLGVGDSIVVTIEIEVTSDIFSEDGFKNSLTTDFLVIMDPLDPPTTLTITTLSNSSILIVNPDLQLLKSSNISNAAVGDVVTYTIVVENTGNITLTNIIVRDLLEQSLLFVDKSLKVDGEALLNASISSGVRINSLNPGESVVITFDVLIIGDSSKISTNTSTAQFNYMIDCNTFTQTGFTTSNEYEIDILYHHLTLTKQADDCAAKLTGFINYTITIENDGDVDILDFILKDKLPSHVSFIEDSFKINNVLFNITKVDLLKGISVGPIAIRNTTTIKYSVRISPTSCCPKCSFDNTAVGSYYFNVSDGSVRYRKTDVAFKSVNICK